MNAHRRIQIFSAAVIANGALALGILWAIPAHATDCASFDFAECFPTTACSADIAAACVARKPAGCSVSSTVCLPGTACPPYEQLGECGYD